MKNDPNKYRKLFNEIPVAIIELDYSPLADLLAKQKVQTIINIRKHLSEHSQTVKNVFRNVKVREANRSAMTFFGVNGYRELTQLFVKTFSTDGLDLLVEKCIALLEGETEFSGEFRSRRRNGKPQDVFLRVFIPEDSRNSFQRVIVTLQDITAWKRLERELRKRAQLDGLTKLLNHSTITQRLDEELIRAKRYGLNLSCLMIDLDNFKIINDKFGHQRGDQVLKKVALMIKNCVRKVDLVGRYGGDEFLIILPETKSANARFAAMRIQNMFAKKMFKYQRIIAFQISLSIGITGYPSKKAKVGRDLIALADEALYQAKKAGRNRIAAVN